MGEVLTQVWLKSIEKSVSYLTKEVNAQKESLKTSRVHSSSHKPTKKCENDMCIDRRKHFIGCLQ